jgi:hypothetical protein
MDYTKAHNCDDFDGDCTYCGRIAARRARVAQQATGRTVPFYVVGYLIHRPGRGRYLVGRRRDRRGAQVLRLARRPARGSRAR